MSLGGAEASVARWAAGYFFFSRADLEDAEIGFSAADAADFGVEALAGLACDDAPGFADDDAAGFVTVDVAGFVVVAVAGFEIDAVPLFFSGLMPKFAGCGSSSPAVW